MIYGFIKQLEDIKENTTTEKNFATTDLLQKLVNYLCEKIGERPIEETEVMLLKVLLDEIQEATMPTLECPSNKILEQIKKLNKGEMIW